MHWDKSLVVSQLDRKLTRLPKASKVPVFKNGWIKTIRKALGMSGRTLGSRIGVNQAQISKLERSEVDKAITLRSLERVAEGLGCELVYYMRPKQDSLELTIENQAYLKAAGRLSLVNVHMALEDQKVEKDEVHRMIEHEAVELMRQLPRDFWDE